MRYSINVNEEVKDHIKKTISLMQKHRQKLEFVHTIRKIIDVESDVGKLYYPNFARAFKPELGFHSRNNHRNFRPYNATAIVNGLLNYGFPSCMQRLRSSLMLEG